MRSNEAVDHVVATAGMLRVQAAELIKRKVSRLCGDAYALVCVDVLKDEDDWMARH